MNVIMIICMRHSKERIRKFYERCCSTIADAAGEPGETKKQWKRGIRTDVQEVKKIWWTQAGGLIADRVDRTIQRY